MCRGDAAALSAASQPTAAVPLPAVQHNLSTRLLVLIVLFVTLSGILIHIPSIAHYREAYLEHRLTDAYMATLLLQMNTAYQLDETQRRLLLEHANVLGITVWHHYPGQTSITLGSTQEADVTVDISQQTAMGLIRDAIITLVAGGERIIRVVGNVSSNSQGRVAIWLDEQSLYNDMHAYTRQVLALSVLISLATAALVYLALQWLMVRPIRRITHSLVAFRQRPEEAHYVIPSSERRDEIGVMERELARMQAELRAALAQQSRLAALGTAVSQINHDFNSILSTVSIASERLAKVDDPTVRKIAPLLVSSVERAVHLCTQTQDLARGDQVVLRRTRFRLWFLVEEVGEALKLHQQETVRWCNHVDNALAINADRERLYRVLLNLGRNAMEAAIAGGEIYFTAACHGKDVFIEITDNGPGIPENIRAHLFQPFVGSARPGGTGLGLATARDLVRAHGGDLVLRRTGQEGTCFRITLPEVLVTEGRPER